MKIQLIITGISKPLSAKCPLNAVTLQLINLVYRILPLFTFYFTQNKSLIKKINSLFRIVQSKNSQEFLNLKFKCEVNCAFTSGRIELGDICSCCEGRNFCQKVLYSTSDHHMHFETNKSRDTDPSPDAFGVKNFQVF